MQQWKPWQIIFLFYLLALNCVILAALAYILLKNDPFAFPPASPEPIVVLAPDSPTAVMPTLLPNATFTPFPSPTPIPAVNIPPAPIPTDIKIEATAISQQIDTPTSTSTPSPSPSPSATSTPTPLPSSTPTPTSSPTATSTQTPSKTPSPTTTASPTATRTPRPSPSATATPSATSTPRPSATPTRTPRPSATPLNKATPRATVTATLMPTLVAAQQNVTPIAVAAVPHSINPARQPEHVPAAALVPIEAIPLTNGSIALSWEPVAQARQYHIYSDMGTGYGVYIYKNHTTVQPAFVDELLRPGMTYQYRVSHLADDQEILVGQAQVATFAPQTSSHNSSTGPAPAPSTKVTAQPTPLPPDAVLLGLISDHNFTDNFNTLTIVGEVRSDSTTEIGNSDITVTFYDAAGTVLETTHGKTILETIAPGGTSPFLITLTRPAGLASYSLRAIARPISARPKSQLSVTETRRFEDDAGFFHIKGSIKNAGNTTAKRIKVAAIIYGRDSRVINVNFAYVNPPNLAPGQQGTYDVIFSYYPAYFDQAVVPFEE